MYSEGNIYIFKATRFRWQFIRILKNADDTVHIRLYSRLFWRKPNVESFNKNKWSIGHLPMTEDELEGYRIWEEDEDAGTFP